jgi:pimeloyl-ACP methyl ester carboxylesterase
MSERSTERIVLVPGVGLAGAELLLLSLRLRRKGYRVSLFRHWTGKHPLDESALALWKAASAWTEEAIHFVGHSLGGLVILRMLESHAWDRPGRVVTLGTPHAGLGVARRLERIPGARRLLGPAVLSAANGDPIAIPNDRQVGVLAGNRSPILGSVIVPGEPSDTLIAVAETRHPGSHAHLTMPETHYSMLFTSRVATRIDSFLREGRFASD